MFKASGFGVDGFYDETDKQGITRATIGAGDINIRDKEKQAELESSGKTQKVANINRDLDKAQEVTKDERKAFGVYATDTSVKHAIEAGKVAAEAIQEIGEAIGEAAQSLSKSLEELTAENAETDYEKVLVQSRAQLTSIEGYSPEEANAALEEVHNLLEQGKLQEVIERAENGDKAAQILVADMAIQCKLEPARCNGLFAGESVGGGGAGIAVGIGIGVLMNSGAGDEENKKEEKQKPNRDSQLISTPKNPQIDPGGDQDEPGGDGEPTEQDAKDAKRLSKNKANEAARNNGYRDAHDLKDDYGLDRTSDLFVDKKGRIYAGPRKGSGAKEYLNLNKYGQ